MAKKSLNNRIHFPYHSPWRLRRTPPAKIYFTDQALPPDDHIETDQALPPDDHVEENLDCSYLLWGLWPEKAKGWFIWGEKPRAIQVAVDVEKLCGDFDIKKWWWEKIQEFVKLKVACDERKVAGGYVDPRGVWPFDPCHPREISLPGDFPAIYAILCRFHDWLPGFDLLFSEGDPAVVEFRYSHPRSFDIDFEQQFEQRSVRIGELEEFLELVKQDIEENNVRREAENLIEKPRTPDKDLSKQGHEERVEGKEAVGEVKPVIKLSKPQEEAWKSYQWVLRERPELLTKEDDKRWYTQEMYEYIKENGPFYHNHPTNPTQIPSYDSWTRHLRQADKWRRSCKDNQPTVYDQPKTAVRPEDVEYKDLSKLSSRFESDNRE